MSTKAENEVRTDSSSRNTTTRWALPVLILLGLTMGTYFWSTHSTPGGWEATSSLSVGVKNATESSAGGSDKEDETYQIGQVQVGTSTTTKGTVNGTKASTPEEMTKYVPKTIGDSSLLPLILGVGMGSTGTHSMFQATCRLGIPSVHGNVFCAFPNGTAVPESKDDYIAPLWHAIAAHARVKSLFYALSNCAYEARTLSKSRLQAHTTKRNSRQSVVLPEDFYHLPSQKEHKRCKHEMDFMIDQLVESVAEIGYGGMVGLHDTPYPQMASMLRLWNRSIAGVDTPPLVVTSDREPTAWVASRQRMHGWSPDTICWNTTHAMHFFDCWIHSTNKDPAQLFFPLGSIKEKHNKTRTEAFKQRMARSMKAYQRRVHYEWKPIFSVNFFEESWDSNNVTAAMWHSLKTHLHPTAIQQLETVQEATQLQKKPGLVQQNIRNPQVKRVFKIIQKLRKESKKGNAQ